LSAPRVALLLALAGCGHDALLGAQCPAGEPSCPVASGSGGTRGDAPMNLDAGPDAVAMPELDAATSGACEAEPIAYRIPVCVGGVLEGAPLARAGRAYTLRLRSNLSTDMVFQVQGMSQCLLSSEQTVSLSAGPNEIEVCLAAAPEDRYVNLTFISGLADPALWDPASLGGELCEGCP
jgi:hypothetical protein